MLLGEGFVENPDIDMQELLDWYLFFFSLFDKLM